MQADLNFTRIVELNRLQGPSWTPCTCEKHRKHRVTCCSVSVKSLLERTDPPPSPSPSPSYIYPLRDRHTTFSTRHSIKDTSTYSLNDWESIERERIEPWIRLSTSTIERFRTPKTPTSTRWHAKLDLRPV